jgi:hypothetical protein
LAYMIELSERPAQRTPSHRWTLDALRAALAAGRARQAICMFLEAAEDYARRIFESVAVWRESHVFRDPTPLSPSSNCRGADTLAKARCAGARCSGSRRSWSFLFAGV